MIPFHTITGPEDAPVLVLSNSLGSTTAMWDPQVPALAERLRVVRYDQRGHGASPVPPGISSSSASLARMRTLLSTRTGAGKRTLLSP